MDEAALRKLARSAGGILRWPLPAPVGPDGVATVAVPKGRHEVHFG